MPIGAFHTHPGHPNGVPTLGFPEPSPNDLNSAAFDKAELKVNLTYYILAKKQMTVNSVTSNTSIYGHNLNWKLREKSWKK